MKLAASIVGLVVLQVFSIQLVECEVPKVRVETPQVLKQNSSASNGTYSGLREAYKTINDYLIENLKSDEAESNMRFATEWLEKNLTKSGSSDRQLVEAVGNLTELGRIANGGICNKASHKILEVNDNGTEGRTRKFSYKGGVFRRMDKLVRHHVKKYTDRCRSTYSANLKKKYAQLERPTVERVENLTGSFIEKKVKRDSREALVMAMYNYFAREPHIGINDGPFLREKIGWYAREDPDRIYLNSTADERLGVKFVNRTKVSELYKKYLVKPCEYYVAELKDIFELADFENKLYHDIDSNDYDYYLIWSRYEICKSVVNDSYPLTLLNMAVKYNS